MLTPLHLPNAPLSLSKKGKDVFVVCLLRKKKVKLTPEEWVRQHVIYFLIAHRNYPESLIKIEHGIHIHQLFRRCDLVLYDRNANPRIIVECKAPEIAVSQLTFEQAAHYNQQLKTDYLLLTNGLQHQIIQMDMQTKDLVFLEDVPFFEELKL